MRKFSSLFITLLLLLQCIPCVNAFAENSVANETIRVIAASDFQPQTDIATGKNAMESILTAMEQDNITSADGFLFCGDYDYSTVGNSVATMAGVQAVKDVVSEIVPQENMVFAQGNHDTADGISQSGKNDPASGDYGVFVINEDDYMWFNNDENRIKNTTQNLIDYLNGKLAISYDKPIFIVSHLPLHYTRRTEKDGDGQHANYIFNVLNESGAKGLNLFFLFGHNHSSGWDDHMGGSAIYLTKGDEIIIAQNSRAASDCKTEVLNFTYLNAGYVGYYGDNVDTLLTMTVFEITNNQVSVSRYNKDGIQLLKKRGTNEYKKVYHSPQVTVLMDVPQQVHFLKNCISTHKTGKGSISIIGGIATIEDIAVDFSAVGETVRITAEKAPDGMAFDGWMIEKGDMVLLDKGSTSTTFTMPDGEVKIVAQYKPLENSKALVNGCNGSIDRIATVVVICGILAFFVCKRKKC